MCRDLFELENIIDEFFGASHLERERDARREVKLTPEAKQNFNVYLRLKKVIHTPDKTPVTQKTIARTIARVIGDETRNLDDYKELAEAIEKLFK